MEVAPAPAVELLPEGDDADVRWKETPERDSSGWDEWAPA